mgnify:CR=1 FL=1
MNLFFCLIYKLYCGLNAESIFLDEKETAEAKKGKVITIKVPKIVREKDQVYVMRKR